MTHSSRFILPLMILSVVGLSCSLPVEAAPTPDTDAIQTFIAETMTAASIQTARVTLTPTLTPTRTFTPDTPTVTPTVTITPTITLTVPPPFTSTPEIPLISVSVDTNCRNGPGKAYGLEGALLVDETAEVFGRDPTGNYWYIRNPDPGDEFCWVWGQYATLEGNTSVLPVFTPPPTPTPTLTPTPAPNFDLSFSAQDNCAGNWWVEITLTNTSSLSFRSMGFTVKDKDTDRVETDYTDGFKDRSGCYATITKDILAPGQTFVVSSPNFEYDMDGHNLRATIILCSNTGQAGQCVTKILNFKP